MRCLSVLLAVTPLAAQVTTGSVAGFVFDPANRPVPGVRISVIDTGRGVGRSTMSGASGFYRIADLNPGLYRISATCDGFDPVMVPNAPVEVNTDLRADMRLALAGRKDTVMVHSQIGTVMAESSGLGTVLRQDMISTLPLNQRDFLQLALLSPGVLPPVQGSELSTRGNFAMHANGGREEFNNFLLDGVDNNDQDTNRYVLQPAVDAIQEFKIATNAYSAEYGRSAAGQVNVITRSGSNDFHGSLYEYLRNRDLDARNFFDGSQKPQYIRNQFGAGVGGPISRDRTFFFADYDGLRGRQGFSRLATVPTAAQRSGDLSGPAPVIDPLAGAPFPGNIIPASRISPIARQILNLYPQPTNRDLAGNYLAQPIGQDSLNQFNVRLDHRIASADQITVRYSYGYKKILEPFAENSQDLPGFGDLVGDRGHNALLNYVRVLSPATTNSLLLGFNRVARRIVPQNYQTDVNGLWGVRYLPSRPIEFGFPSINVLGLALAGDVATLPIDRHNNTYQLTDSLALVRGRHGIQIGAEFRKLELNGLIDVYARGSLSFLGAFTQSGVGDLLLGLPTFTIQGHSTAPQTLRTFASNFYVQDDWKLRPNLMVNVGLRYEFNTPPTDPTNRMSVLDLASRGLIQVGTNGKSRSGIAADYQDFAPRIGVAWSPWKAWVIRAGYGLFYDAGMFVVNSSLYFNPPYFTLQVFTPSASSLITLQDPFPNAEGFSPPASLSTLSPNIRTAYLQAWNFGLQRSIERVGTLSVAYAGSKGTHLIRSRDLNQPRPGTGEVDARRPYQGFSNIFLIESGANSNFNSLQVSFARPLVRGLTVLGTYMFSKSIDDTSAFLGTIADKNFPQDSANFRAERAASSFDMRRYATAAVVYSLPGRNWLTRNVDFKGVLRAQTGQPFTPLLTADNSNTGNSGGQFGSDRPNLVHAAHLSKPGPQEWFDTSAFAVPVPYTFGNAGRNVLRGPGYSSLDFAISRKVAVTERLAVRFEVQMFNTLNWTNFDLPELYVDQPGFGRIFSAKAPRQVQLSLRFGF